MSAPSRSWVDHAQPLIRPVFFCRIVLAGTSYHAPSSSSTKTMRHRLPLGETTPGPKTFYRFGGCRAYPVYEFVNRPLLVCHLGRRGWPIRCSKTLYFGFLWNFLQLLLRSASEGRSGTWQAGGILNDANADHSPASSPYTRWGAASSQHPDRIFGGCCASAVIRNAAIHQTVMFFTPPNPPPNWPMRAYTLSVQSCGARFFLMQEHST